MDIYNVGPIELDQYDFEELGNEWNWIVYWYSIDGYEGDGKAILLDNNGKLFCKDLAHCSCWGPLDGMDEIRKVSKDEIFNQSDSIFDVQYRDEIVNKVKELLGE